MDIKRPSFMFRSLLLHVYNIFLQKDEFVPLPNTDVPLYSYVTPLVDTCGPPVPQMELLAARG